MPIVIRGIGGDEQGLPGQEVDIAISLVELADLTRHHGESVGGQHLPRFSRYLVCPQHPVQGVRRGGTGVGRRVAKERDRREVGESRHRSRT
jgi:hypothetical protein